MEKRSVIIGLGTNIGNKLSNLRYAVKLLNNIKYINIVKLSKIYTSPALLKIHSPKSWNKDFFNMAIHIEITKDLHILLKDIQKIEIIMGRECNHLTWSPRIIDLDILASQNTLITTKHLTVPHKELLKRSFALIPLLELTPTWQHPKYKDLDLEVLCRQFLDIKPTYFRIYGSRIMGIVNLTQESMSGLKNKNDLTIEAVTNEIINLVNNGAEIIDIGAESTRPNAAPLMANEEWKILEPIIKQLDYIKNKEELLLIPEISIDTYHNTTIRNLQAFNIDYINNIYSQDTTELKKALYDFSGKYIFMHNLGRAGLKYIKNSDSALEHVINFYKEQYTKLINFGLEKSQLIYDLGFGFGKKNHHILELIHNIKTIRKFIDIPILAGHSRKSSVMPSTSHLSPIERDLETAMMSKYLSDQGINILRVHNSNYTSRLLHMELPEPN